VPFAGSSSTRGARAGGSDAVGAGAGGADTSGVDAVGAGAGVVEPDDLSGNLIVQLGLATETLIWRRLPDGSGKVEAAGARALFVGDAEPLGHNIIHSVTNPIPRLTGAIHVYGGDFFAVERNECIN
jgi:hypothetical protein